MLGIKRLTHWTFYPFIRSLFFSLFPIRPSTFSFSPSELPFQPQSELERRDTAPCWRARASGRSPLPAVVLPARSAQEEPRPVRTRRSTTRSARLKSDGAARHDWPAELWLRLAGAELRQRHGGTRAEVAWRRSASGGSGVVRR